MRRDGRSDCNMRCPVYNIKTNAYYSRELYVKKHITFSTIKIVHLYQYKLMIVKKLASVQTKFLEPTLILYYRCTINNNILYRYVYVYIIEIALVILDCRLSFIAARVS